MNIVMKSEKGHLQLVLNPTAVSDNSTISSTNILLKIDVKPNVMPAVLK